MIHIRNGDGIWCRSSPKNELTIIDRSAVAALPEALKPWVCRTCLARISARATLYVCQYCDAGLGLYSAMSHVSRCQWRPAALTSGDSPFPLVIRFRLDTAAPAADRVKISFYEIK